MLSAASKRGGKVFGPEILARTLSNATRRDKYGNAWQYHSRSDHHSKVACWGIIFDLLRTSPLLRRHVRDGTVNFGINHEIRDFRQDRKKNLDLVVCTPDPSRSVSRKRSFGSIASEYLISLNLEEAEELRTLPNLEQAAVGSVLMALEAKACMTAHQRALPRLYDELNSSHLTVHGSSQQAIAAAFVMVNLASDYLSPDLNKSNRSTLPEWSRHNQPRDAQLAVDKVLQIPRRTRMDDTGYDALAIVIVECANDGSPVRIAQNPPAPDPGSIHHYASMIVRLAHLYATRFKDL